MMSKATADSRQQMHPAETASGTDGRASWLLCRAGHHLYAVPLEHVIENMRALPIETVFGAPRYVRGLCMIRGAPVPVVDPGLLLGEQPTKSQRLVTIRAGRRTIALAADVVLGIRAIEADLFKQLPPLLRDAAAETITAIGTLDAELLFLLHAARIIPQDLFDRLDAEGASS
jgi:purine-binding chemotaxis protein CheW